MIATQYKITLPSDYDMNIIRNRVRDNGHKTDGFEDLKFKLYLVTEKGTNNNIQNSYCPLYLWKDSNGLNKFLFNGYYDNILRSFGWQRVNVGIPLIDSTTSNIKENRYLFQITRKIQPQESLKNLIETIGESVPTIDRAEYLVIYNPDKWEYDVFYFLSDLSGLTKMEGVIYNILHLSKGEHFY
ncbi:DUF4865 family protein [Paenibacillus sp. BSR1-1]|uniref:DUF4865 family protein n=1 Tax=Paenibacillus sp. BSR1-1 TaxID=3020845 RepID=UPI0025B03157|nr:DUF4865 family protein [Paenibacillus sp. BSR1-1]MDN3015476.1 DUF4865 family protein [Paenibacillus sp. BSR1-1]